MTGEQDEEDGFTTPGDEVRGRLHWQYFLDGRVGLALLRSPRTPQPNPYSQGVWTVGHGGSSNLFVGVVCPFFKLKYCTF